MPQDFWWNVASEVCGGALVAVVFGLIVSEILGVRKWAAAQRQERAERASSAIKYISLLRGEIGGIIKVVPAYCEGLAASPMGTEVPIYTPVWDVVIQSGELVGLLEPEVLTRTAYFYGYLQYAKEAMGWLMLSWHVADDTVGHLEGMQTQCRDAVAQRLTSAKAVGEEVLKLYDDEERRLEDMGGE
jgi:hypothetical protein